MIATTVATGDGAGDALSRARKERTRETKRVEETSTLYSAKLVKKAPRILRMSRPLAESVINAARTDSPRRCGGTESRPSALDVRES